MTLRRYKPAHIKRTAEPHLSLLTTEEGYLEGFSWPREGNRTYLEVCFAGEFPKPRRLTDQAQAFIDEIVDTFDEEGSRRYYGEEELPEDMPDHITMGGEDEAAEYARACGPAWKATPGALDGLARTVAELPPPPKRRTGSLH